MIPRSTVKFSFEVPIANLDDFEDLQDYHYTLSYLWRQSDIYPSFYKEQAELGFKKIWVDNSYNELMQADDVLDLLDVANQVELARVVSPDSPEWDTQRILQGFAQTAERFAFSDILVVVKNKRMMSTLKRAGAKNFAISYWTRGKMSWEYLHDLTGQGGHTHYLGLLSVKELCDHSVASCDTSMPIKLALLGKTIEEWIVGGCQHVHTKNIRKTFFSTPLNVHEVRLARENIKYLKETVYGSNPWY